MNSINLKPLSYQSSSYPIVGFDCETHGEDNDFVLGVVSDWAKAYWFDDKDEMLGWLTQHRYRDVKLFATNLMFDFFALNPKPDEHWVLMFNGSNLFGIEYWDKKVERTKTLKNGETRTYMVKSHFWRFMDTLNLNYHMSVDKMGKVIGMPKMDKPDFLGQMPVGDDEWDYLYRYCQRDAEITRAFMEWFQNVLVGMGARLKYTAPSVAMDYWRKKHLPKPMKQPDMDLLPLFYDGYYGGRTEVFRKGSFDEEMYYYDVNSLYPKIMRDEPFPDVDTIKYRKLESGYTFDPDWLNLEGISHVTVHVPNLYVPILPLKHDHKTMFPVGDIEGTWAHNELRYALSLGCEILDWEWTIYYDDTREYFKSFVDELYELRMEHKAEGNPVEIIDKFLMNSAYGKFALKQDGSAGTFKPISAYMIKCDNPYPLCWYECKKDCLVGKEIYQDKWVVQGFPNTPSYVNPIISIYVTAGARVHMHKYLSDIGKELVYSDTDSIISPMKYKTGDALGELKLEHVLTHATFIRPKLYEFHSPITPLSKMHIPQIYELAATRKCKGIPGKALSELFNNMRHGLNEIEYEKFLRFKEAHVRKMPVNRKVMIKKHLDLSSAGDKRLALHEVDLFSEWTPTVPHEFAISEA